jgi:putative DNA primase/helicase
MGWKNLNHAPGAMAAGRATALFKSLDELDAVALGAQHDDDPGVPYLRFTDSAQIVFDEWRAKLGSPPRSGEEHAVMESHLAKYHSLIASLALLSHLASGEKGLWVKRRY